MYDAKNPSVFTLEDCEHAVGKRASITLEGVIEEAGESPAGAFVIFKIDDRFGFGDAVLVVDLDVLAVQE